MLKKILCGCETWTCALKEEHGLRVFEIRMLRKVVRIKREEVTGNFKHFIMMSVTLFACPNIIVSVKSCEMKWAICLSRVGEE
jgi:hypothetical protein